MTKELTLRDYLRVLWSGRWILLAFVIGAAVIGAITSVAKPAEYTAVARVSLGQATTRTGAPVQTARTSPTTAPTTLKTDAIIREVAEQVGVRPGVVRNAVTLTAPRVVANAGNQPTVLTITSATGDRDRSIKIANAYSDQVYAILQKDFEASNSVLTRHQERAAKRVESLNDEISRLRQQQIAAGSGERALVFQIAVSSALSQLEQARLDLEETELAVAKGNQVEAPTQLVVAESASSTGAAPKRLQSIIFAALIGLLIGVLATFVWKGSPAGRAAVD